MSNKAPVKCPHCGFTMNYLGKQNFRTGPINEAVSLVIYPELGMPVSFDTYVCEACGKLELFADETARKLMKGEYAGDALAKCGKCGRQYVKEYLKCPYCGADSSCK
jgi:DNA-directed RNA polymerase subunit RPC12/RpoP